MMFGEESHRCILQVINWNNILDCNSGCPLPVSNEDIPYLRVFTINVNT